MGTELSFYAADGPAAELTLLHQVPSGSEDLRHVEIGGSTGGPQAALDVRFTDLRVRAGAAPEEEPETPAATLGVRRSWLRTVALLAGVVTLAGLLAAYRRRRR